MIKYEPIPIFIYMTYAWSVGHMTNINCHMKKYKDILSLVTFGLVWWDMRILVDPLLQLAEGPVMVIVIVTIWWSRGDDDCCYYNGNDMVMVIAVITIWRSRGDDDCCYYNGNDVVMVKSYLEIGVASRHKHLRGLWLVCTIVNINIKLGGLQNVCG